jgi:hypothetical protein
MATVRVSCPIIADSNPSLPIGQVTVITGFGEPFPADGFQEAHVRYLCPSCQEVHTTAPGPELCAELVALGAQHDLPTAPDAPPQDLAA